MFQIHSRYFLTLVSLVFVILLSACGTPSTTPPIDECRPVIGDASETVKFEDIRANALRILSADNSLGQLEPYLRPFEGEHIAWQG